MDEVDGLASKIKASFRSKRNPKKDEIDKTFQFVDHRRENRPSPARPPPIQSTNKKQPTENIPQINSNPSNQVKVKDTYSEPLEPAKERKIESGYVTAIPPQNTKHEIRPPFYTPPGSREGTQMRNENNNSSYKPAPPPRKSAFHIKNHTNPAKETSPPPVHHRRSRSDQLVQLPKLKIPASDIPMKYGTIHSPITPTPRNTAENSYFDPSQVPVTPGLNENPLSFRLREQEKSASLQNQPNRTGFNGHSADDQSLEFLMYGASAYKNQDFVKSQELDKSTTDWEGIKSQLKKEQKELTKRLSQRQSWDDILESRFIAGLDPEEHFYYKPKATREDTLQILKDMPEGSFIVRQSRKSNSFALSLLTYELGVQHILIQESNLLWKISSGSQSQLDLPVFESIPRLVEYYRKIKLPIKGCQREVFLK